MTHRDLATFQLDDDFPKLYKFKRMLGHHHFHPTKLLRFGVPGSQVVDSPTRWSSTQCCIGKKMRCQKIKKKSNPSRLFLSAAAWPLPQTIPSPSPKKGHQTTKNGRRNFRCQQVTGVLCFNNIPMSFLGHCLEVLVSSFATTSKKVKRGISEWWKTLVGSVPPWGEKHLGSLQNGLGVKLF